MFDKSKVITFPNTNPLPQFWVKSAQISGPNQRLIFDHLSSDQVLINQTFMSTYTKLNDTNLC